MDAIVSDAGIADPTLRELVALHLRDVADEIDAEMHLLEGEVPAGLDGVWWRNGPARFERGGVRYGHPFDGDGMITRFDIGPTTRQVRTRFVRTPEFIAEERADKILYRGFGTQKPGGIAANIMRLQFKNAANTSVIWHAGRLHALWEGGSPTQIDATTLETLGRDTLDGVLGSHGPTPPTFSAHPCRDASTGTLYNFGLRWGLRQRLMIYAIDAVGNARVERSIALERLTFIHDFMMTPNWFVFLLPAVRFDIARMALGMVSPVHSLRCEAEKPMIALLVPRDGGKPISIPTVPGFVFHMAGAYEQANGHVVCDVMRLDTIPAIDDLDHLFDPASSQGCAHPLRIMLDPAGRAMHSAQSLDESDTATELPIIAAANGDPYRSLWATAASPNRRQPYHSALVRIEPGVGIVARRDMFPALPSEPCFVRKPDAKHAEDGWLLTVIHRPGAAAELWVLDAGQLDVVARLRIPAALPPSLHGCWANRGEMVNAADLVPSQK